MIRYVVAVLLTTAVLGVAAGALEHGSTVRSETQVERQIVAIENAAVSLVENDDPVPREQDPPRRSVDIELPGDGFAETGVETLVFEPVDETDRTVVRYALDGHSERTTFVDAPVVGANAETDSLDFSDLSGSQTVVLELVLDERHEPVVRVTLT